MKKSPEMFLGTHIDKITNNDIEILQSLEENGLVNSVKLTHINVYFINDFEKLYEFIKVQYGEEVLDKIIRTILSFYAINP